jgi:serine/threonine protein kinase/Flp pilus assembly protein TadD
VISVTRICTKCGAEIPADAPEGGCPGCLFESGLRLLDEEAVAGAVDPSHVDEPAPTRKRSEYFAAMLGELGDYELLEEVGRGGQGVVFRARQKSLNRTVALKIISLGQWASREHLKRFRREAEAAARLKHPNIVPIHEVGERDGSCYFSMQFVEGGQLDEVVKRTPVSIRQAAEFIAKVARTVHYAHEHGILHRDIKPGNILLDEKGEPHLTDFGLARLLDTESTVTRTVEVMGTPSYMAPEQASGKNAELTKATDVYGLGAVLYQLLTGHPPFAGGTTYETIKLLLDTEPRAPRSLNPKIDRELSAICLKCLEKDPQRRYSSALALSEDLEHWLKHKPIQAKPSGFFTHARKWVRRNPAIAALIASLVAFAAAVSWVVWKSELLRQPLTKGIAVLPFHNLSSEPENAYFADGIQDDVLTSLANIGQLKVISRTSVMQYRNSARNLRQIARDLGVANILEGSVRRSGSRVRVSVQLIDANTDQHLWANDYDRDLTDVFAIQSDLAREIAKVLQAKLSPAEKSRMTQKPTENGEAYLAFVLAHNLSGAFEDREKLKQSEQLYQRAMDLDPKFALAIAGYSRLESWLVHDDADHTQERRNKAGSLAEQALQLQPDLPEAHLAMGFSYYYGDNDYNAALKEFEIAQRGLPNESEVYLAIGAIQRRQGKWAESTANLEKAVSLNPKDWWPLQNLAFNYAVLRNFDAANETIDHALELNPQGTGLWYLRAQIAISEKGDLTAWEKVMEKVKTYPMSSEQRLRFVDAEANLLLLQRKYQQVLQFYENTPDRSFAATPSLLGAKYLKIGVAKKNLRNDAAARSAFEKAKTIFEEQLTQEREDPDLHVELAKGLAWLGERDAAIAEAQRATDLRPESKDAFEGPDIIERVAQVYAILGENARAIELLGGLLNRPSNVTVQLLRVNPIWDPLRGDPAFQKLCEEKQK